MGLFDIFSNSDAQDAANAKIGGLNAGYNAASTLFGQGRDAITDYYGKATAPYSNIFTNLNGTGTAGYNAYADATGANGAEGLTRADAAFRATPGFQEGLNLTLDANDKRAASRGMLNSGNTLADTAKLATDYASQKYGQYVAGLSPYMNVPGQETAAANGYGTLTAGEGNSLNSSYGNQGNLAFQTQSGIGNAQAAADMANYGASQNMWGALMGGANMLAGFL